MKGVISGLYRECSGLKGREVQGGKPWFPSLAFTGEPERSEGNLGLPLGVTGELRSASYAREASYSAASRV